MQLAIGRVGRPHGTGGEVAVEIMTDDPEARFASGAEISTDTPGLGPLTVRGARRHTVGTGQRLLVRFAGVRDRAAAERLRGAVLLVDSAAVPPGDDPDEFGDHELIGLAVVTTEGAPVGEITDVVHSGQDLLVVHGQGGGEVLVPFVAAIVREVDPSRRRAVIDPPAGLLDLSAE